jgi:preprotein translocase SecF subunit
VRKFDLVGGRRWFFIGSGLISLGALIILAIPPTFRPGIDFTSGTTAQVHFDKSVDESALRDLYTSVGHSEALIQSTGNNTFLIRTSELKVPPSAFNEPAATPTVVAGTPVGPVPAAPVGTLKLGAANATGDVLLRRAYQGDVCNFGDVAGTFPAGTEAQVLAVHDECGTGDKLVYEVTVNGTSGLVLASNTTGFAAAATATPTPTATATPAAGLQSQTDEGEWTTIQNAMRSKFGTFEVQEFNTVSPLVSRIAVRNASIAVAVAAIFILLYIAWAFSSVPQPFRYGTAAIIAMLHDVTVVLGAFSLFGKLFHMEIDLMFVTGLLTVIGFSVHDTIVVFDRIRENVRSAPQSPFPDNVNAALVQTMARSLNTSLTVLITVLAMLLLGGVTIREFLLVILIGVISGTYSSIGIASQVLVSWEEGDFARWFRLLHNREADTAT